MYMFYYSFVMKTNFYSKIKWQHNILEDAKVPECMIDSSCKPESRGWILYRLFWIRAQIYSTVYVKTWSVLVFVCIFMIRASEEICEIWTFHFMCQKVSKIRDLRYAYNVSNYTQFWKMKLSLKSSFLLHHQIKANI